MAARHVVLGRRKLTTYVYAVGRVVTELESERDPAFQFHSLPASATVIVISLAGWLFDMETIFSICHIEVHLQVLLASRCLQGDIRLWWMAQGDPAIHGIPWVDFRAHMIARYGPLPGEGANAQYRDPDIYGDMYRRRYLNFAVEWHAYPNESMGHYCCRDGLLPEVKYFVPVPEVGVSLEDMIDVIMEAEIIAYMIPPQEAEAGPDDNMDPAEAPDNPRDNAEDPPVIHIESDDEEQEVWEEWEEFEDMEEEELEDLEEQEEDPEEIPFDDEDWDVVSDVTIK
ncbi:hypothetical protein TIFTF001_032057 [Ficus carica]|uniref:Uncharacterized protein n=1 Tax=Ficus carica TaxID=3494 RepID=A0AA88J7D2_FICCA|nr:hypothetical protein TIFTF001_032057 [Ficus carica]